MKQHVAVGVDGEVISIWSELYGTKDKGFDYYSIKFDRVFLLLYL